MNLEPEGVAFDIFGAALACGQDAVFCLELGGGILEGRALGEVAGPLPDLKVQVPFRSDLFGALKVALLGAGAVIAAGQVRRALPEGAAVAAVNVEPVAYERVGVHSTRTHTRFGGKSPALCKCV